MSHVENISGDNVQRTKTACHSSIKIKSENTSDIYQTEEPLTVLHTKTDCDNNALNSLSANSDVKMYSKAGTSIGNLTSSLEHVMKCEVEDSKILFGTGKLIDERDTSKENFCKPSQFSINVESDIAHTPLLPQEDKRSKEKLYDWMDCIGKTVTVKKEFNRQEDVPLQCLNCGKRYSKSETLYCHRLPTICANYKQSFQCKSILKQHQMSQHSKTERSKSYKCYDCKNSYASKRNLRYHRLSQHLNIKPHKCSSCKKSFITKQLLRHHEMFVHSKVKAHMCPDCNKVYSRKGELNYHQKS